MRKSQIINRAGMTTTDHVLMTLNIVAGAILALIIYQLFVFPIVFKYQAQKVLENLRTPTIDTTYWEKYDE